MGNGNIRNDSFSDEDARNSFEAKIKELGGLYQGKNFGGIGYFYKETGAITTHEGKPIRGRRNITEYFTALYKEGVTDVTFNVEFIRVRRVEDIKVSHLLEGGIYQEGDRPPDLNPDADVTHVAHGVISYSFTLGEKLYNQPLPSSWYGFHIDGCPIY